MLTEGQAKEYIGIVRGSLLSLGAPVEVLRSLDKLVAEHYERRKQAEVDKVAERIFEPEKPEKPTDNRPSYQKGQFLRTPEQKAAASERMKAVHAKRKEEKTS